MNCKSGTDEPFDDDESPSIAGPPRLPPIHNAYPDTGISNDILHSLGLINLIVLGNITSSKISIHWTLMYFSFKLCITFQIVSGLH